MTESETMALTWITRTFPALAWKRLHKEVVEDVKETDKVEAYAQAQAIAAQSIRTQELRGPRRTTELPSNTITRYQRPDLITSSILLLTGAILDCQERLTFLPVALYVAENTEMALKLQTWKAMGIPYNHGDGVHYFYFATGAKRIEAIPVLTDLPPALRTIYRNGIPRDTVIASIVKL